MSFLRFHHLRKATPMQLAGAQRDQLITAAQGRADDAMASALAVQTETRKVTAIILERVDRNHLAKSIEATFGRKGEHTA